MKKSLSASDIGIKAANQSTDKAPDSEEVRDWLRELGEARKREKEFRREGKRVTEIYEGKAPVDSPTPFNILYSNTETMMPALYNSTPVPVVQRRFKDEDTVGLMCSQIGERALKYLIDDGNPEYTPFDDLMKSATLEGLLPGRGVTRFKYDATFTESPAPAKGTEAAEESVSYETVCGEEVPWDRFLHGNAKKWKDVPWAAFEHFMTREELEKNFPDIGKEVPIAELVSNEGSETAEDKEETGSSSSASGTAGVKVAQVFEVWDRIGKKVIFVSPNWRSGPLKKVDDPLALQGFFPCPRPLTFVIKISTLVPVSLYTFYETQAKELNIITTRINKITAALKVRGLYDNTVEGLDKVMNADDNTLVPAENVAALQQGNTLEKALFLMPIEKLVTVLQQLYIQREQVKTVIYELTGIADIMRGSSAASETLGAQKLKNQWGTLRLKKTQKEVMRYARDCLRIIAEIAVNKLSPETLKKMTGLPFPTAEEKAKAQQLQASTQAQLQQATMQAQAAGQPPPQPPEPPPGVMEALHSPTWEELLGILRDDMQRNYKIDIETNSTVDAEATEDKQDISELLNAISQFLNGVGPMVQDGTMPFDVAQGMLLAVVRRYRFGPELEDQLKKMKAPQQGNPAELKKQQEEVAKKGEELAKQEADLQKQLADAKKQIEQMQADLDMQKQELALEKKMALREIELQKNFNQRVAQLEQQSAEQRLSMQESAADQRLTMKASLQGESVKRQAQDVDRKAGELSKQQADFNPTAIAAAISEPLMQGLTVLAEKLSEGIVQAAKVQKVAKKQADGSWATIVQ